MPSSIFGIFDPTGRSYLCSTSMMSWWLSNANRAMAIKWVFVWHTGLMSSISPVGCIGPLLCMPYGSLWIHICSESLDMILIPWCPFQSPGSPSSPPAPSFRSPRPEQRSHRPLHPGLDALQRRLAGLRRLGSLDGSGWVKGPRRWVVEEVLLGGTFCQTLHEHCTRRPGSGFGFQWLSCTYICSIGGSYIDLRGAFGIAEQSK